MDRTVVEIMTRAALDGDPEPIQQLFVNHGLAPPVICWQPAADALAVPELASLRGFWDTARAGADGGLPGPARIDPFALKPAPGNLMVLDVLDDGWDYRYRLYGTKIRDRAKRDYTGMRTSELLAGPWITSFCIAMYRAVLARPACLYTENAPPPDVETTCWHRLILPFGEGGAVTRLLVGNVPGPWRPAAG